MAAEKSSRADTNVLIESGTDADAQRAFANIGGSGPLCWGALQWQVLHQFLRAYPVSPTLEHKEALRAYTGALVHLIPCSICARHWATLASTVNVESRVAAMKWAVDVHNTVNKRLHKPVLSYDDAARAIVAMCPHNVHRSSTCQTEVHSVRRRAHVLQNTTMGLATVCVIALAACVVLGIVFFARKTPRSQ